MEFKGTKGKWSVDKSGYRTTNGGLCVMNDNQCIAVVGDGNPHHPIDANALLISKAPEMLEMVKELFELLEEKQGEAKFYTKGHYLKLKELIKSATEL